MCPPPPQLVSDPTPADDHVQHLSTTRTTVILQAPEIDCIDQNGIISEYRISYAESEDFQSGANLRNGLFSPGLVIIGNLLPGTDYTFQLVILTQEGGSVGLEPLTVTTFGTKQLLLSCDGIYTQGRGVVR